MQLESLIKQRKEIERKNAEIRKDIGACRTAIGHHKNSIAKKQLEIQTLTLDLAKGQELFEKLGKVLFTINQI